MFKPGDVVVCVKGDGKLLHSGQRYVVDRYRYDGEDDYTAVVGVGGGWDHDRFAPATAGAVKHDQGKPRTDLMLGPGMLAIGEALAYGAKKYTTPARVGDWNYRDGQGLEWSRLLGALTRHLCKFAMRIELDDESGLPHIAHVGACAIMLCNLVIGKQGKDDRYGNP